MSDENAGPRQRRLRIGLIVGAVVAVVVAAAVVAIVVTGDSDDGPAQQAYERYGAWADGDEVHVGDDHTVTVPGATALAYTSEGVVVTGTDGYVLVTPEGDAEPLDLDVEIDTDVDVANGEVVVLPHVATDAGAPYVAYVKSVADDEVQLVVRDLSSGEEETVGEPAQPGELSIPEDGWLWDDLLFYDDKREADEDGSGTTVDWRSGEQVADADLPFSGGVGLSVDEEGTWTVRSHEGEELLTTSVPDSFFTWASLSPDGRYLLLTDSAAETTVHDVASGESVVLDGIPIADVGEFGWTPDSHLLGQSDDAGSKEVVLCAPDTGRCDGTGKEIAGPAITGRPVTVVVGASDNWS